MLFTKLSVVCTQVEKGGMRNSPTVYVTWDFLHAVLNLTFGSCNGDMYECVAVYVDDLAMSMLDPGGFVTILKDVCEFKVKGTGPIKFHLGCDFKRDEDGTSCMAPDKYINKMVDVYQRMFGSKPSGRKIRNPLEKGDHPELDTA